MKKFFSFILVLSLLVGCSSAPKQSDVSFKELSSAVEKEVRVKRDTIMVSGMDVLEAFLDTQTSNVQNGALMGGFITDATKVIIVEMKNGQPTRPVETILNNILKADQETFEWYVPEQNQFVNDGEVIVRSQFVILVIAENKDDIIKVIDDMFAK